MFVTSGMLANRGMQYAVAGSLLWHLVWLFGISVDLSPSARARERETKIYFLGPVLSDEAFRTMLAAKPEASRTLYRSAEDLGETLEPEIENLGHQSPNDAVSVPRGAAAWKALAGTLRAGGSPTSVFYDRFEVEILPRPFKVTGELAERDLLFLPELPRRASAAEGMKTGNAVFQITVDAAGKVAAVENEISSGDPASDLAWRRYLKNWQFMPLADPAAAPQTGEVRLGIPES